MSDKCDHDCSKCEQKCEEQKNKFLVKPHELSNIKKVIGVISGKGGVGKSLTTSLLTVLMQRKGYKTAILDADITGPSIPKIFGIDGNAKSDKNGLYPLKTKLGTEIMSLNLLLPNNTDPVIWRGPIIANTVRQFWSKVIWKDVDYMFVDMPPGTGDVPLTVFQSLPLDGIVVVTSPQELVEMIVDKAIKMSNLMNIPVIGIVENMSYFKCPNCDNKHYIFGESHIDKIAKKSKISTISKIPIEPKLAKLCDKGMIEVFKGEWLDNMANKIEKL